MKEGNVKNIKANITFFLIVFFFVFYISYDFYKYQIKKDIKEGQISISNLLNLKFEPIGGDLLGKAELSYAGGTEGRNKNIELGISRINGMVILPGQEFSFKKSLGSITPEDGFSEERIFLNGEVTKGVGGGLCQVSTVLFRTALASGLTITERSNHSYSVSRYDAGLDATYSDPGPDLKFLNDTGHPILIKGKAENLKAIFEIYGRNDGRISSTTEVEITNIIDYPPTKYVYTPELEEGQSECVNTPQIGYTAKIKYIVTYPDGINKEKTFVSKYKPLQRVCYIVGDKIKDFDIKKILNN